MIEAASDAFNVLFDDGVYLSFTGWVPARECARAEDIPQMKPIRRSGGYIDR